MPSKGARKRLVDVLGEKVNDNSMILTKFILLLQRIEATNPSIDHLDLRWVEHKIEQLKSGVVLTKEDLKEANKLYKTWEKY
jgi:hypothetical protein